MRRGSLSRKVEKSRGRSIEEEERGRDGKKEMKKRKKIHFQLAKDLIEFEVSYIPSQHFL